MLKAAPAAPSTPTAPSVASNKDAGADPEIVKEDIEKMKEEVINKKSQMLLFKQLVKVEGVDSTIL